MTDNFNIFIFKISVIEIHISILKIILREPDFEPIGLNPMQRSHYSSNTKFSWRWGWRIFIWPGSLLVITWGKASFSCLLCFVWADISEFFSLGRQLQFQPNICLGEGLARIIQRKRNIQLSDLSKARKIEFLWLLWLPANDLHNSLLSVWRCRGKTLSPHPHPEQFIHLGRDEPTIRLIQERQLYFFTIFNRILIQPRWNVMIRLCEISFLVAVFSLNNFRFSPPSSKNKKHNNDTILSWYKRSGLTGCWEKLLGSLLRRAAGKKLQGHHLHSSYCDTQTSKNCHAMPGTWDWSTS